jgi:hypothetical protein
MSVVSVFIQLTLVQLHIKMVARESTAAATHS